MQQCKVNSLHPTSKGPRLREKKIAYRNDKAFRKGNARPNNSREKNGYWYHNKKALQRHKQKG